MFFKNQIMNNLLYQTIRYLFFLILICKMSLHLNAQISTEDVIHLKDGTIYYGQIIEQKVGEYVKLELIGGSLMIIEQEKIDRITRKPSRYRSINRVMNFPVKSLYFHEKGVYKALATSFSFGEGRWGGVRLDMSLNYRLGYRFSRYLGVGGGIGLSDYRSGLIVPLFLDVHGDLLRKHISPYYHFQFGYGWGATSHWPVDEIRGGWMNYGALGVKIRTIKRLEWVFSLGYKSQQNLEIDRVGGNVWPQPLEPTLIEREVVYRGLLWQVSFFF